jgi:hypothetical protein
MLRPMQHQTKERVVTIARANTGVLTRFGLHRYLGLATYWLESLRLDGFVDSNELFTAHSVVPCDQSLK